MFVLFCLCIQHFQSSVSKTVSTNYFSPTVPKRLNLFAKNRRTNENYEERIDLESNCQVKRISDCFCQRMGSQLMVFALTLNKHQSAQIFQASYCFACQQQTQLTKFHSEFYKAISGSNFELLPLSFQVVYIEVHSFVRSWPRYVLL